MVTPTEKAKRSEALYYDNHNITRRTLCDRVVNLESDMEEIKAENAKLRELCSELLRMAESNDPDFLHWPEIHDELRKVGVEIVQL